MNVEAIFNRFEWNAAQFQPEGKQLSELVSQIQGVAVKTDEELKVLSATYTDKNMALAAAKRRQVINLTTSDFEDFLKPEAVAKLDMINSENLLTVMVVVPKALEQGNVYHSLILPLFPLRVFELLRNDRIDDCCLWRTRLVRFIEYW